MNFWRNSLRSRLTLYFVLFFIFPVTIVGGFAYQQGRQALLASTISRLETAAVLKESEINSWIGDNQRTVRLLAQSPVVEALATPLLTLNQSDPSFQAARQSLGAYLTGVLAETPDVLELALLNNVGGKVVLSTTGLHEGNFHVTDTFFTRGRDDTYIQNAYYSTPLGQTTITIATPVRSTDGQKLGVLVAHLDLDRLNQIILERTGLGATGETYLVDSLNVFVSQARSEQGEFARGVHTQGIDRALAGQNDSGLYPNYRDTPVIGVYRWLADREMALLVEIEQGEAFSPVARLGLVIFSISLAIIVLASLVAYLVGRQISGPIQTVAQVAAGVAAGDLDRRVPVTTADEIGDLARTFNQMTTQLKALYSSLEQQVAARTRRLEIVASLGERLGAILDLNQLLAEVVNQVKENFDYYHAHIYLLEPSRRLLTVAAGTGEAGAAMEARKHSISLDAPTSLVARAARTGQVVTADNVREAEDWLPNPLLPDTRSEMAVPIRLKGEMLGVLDVQQDQIAGLDEGDAGLLRSLASRIAVAIENARLFKQVEAELNEARALQERYLHQAWDRARVAQKGRGLARFSAEGLPPLNERLIRAAGQKAAQQTGPGVVTLNGNLPADGAASQPPEPEIIPAETPSPPGRHAFVAPITISNTVIGNMQLHGVDPDKVWADSELAVINAVIDQVAQVAENLRLFEETQERAGREKLITGIGDKMRRAPNMETLLKTTVAELAQALGPARTFVRLDCLDPQSQLQPAAPPAEEER
ncbi:MAG: GAF domain-containing protein [Anaerolineae bacterium]